MWFIYTILGLQVFFWALKLVDRYSSFKAVTLQWLPKIDPLYESMSGKHKRRFRTKYNDFLRTTKFLFKKGIPLEQRNLAKVIIGLSAARLCLFLSRKAFDQYEKIIIYPDSYYSTLGRAYHKGEVNPGMGFIVFSFEAVLKGFDQREGVNLVYHELAHALWLEHKLFDYSVFNDQYLDDFEILAKKEMEHAHVQAEHFMRNYGYTSLAEFFAVSVENFFERPGDLRKALPNLYASLTGLFKQDPIQ